MQKKKLSLHKETIRSLNEEDLGKVAGGNTSGPRCPRQSYIDFPGTICPKLICVPFTTGC